MNKAEFTDMLKNSPNLLTFLHGVSERFRQVDGVCCDVEGNARVAGASLRGVAGSLVGERRPAPETRAPARL